METHYGYHEGRLYAQQVAPDGTVHDRHLIAVIPNGCVLQEDEFKEMVERASDCDGLRDYFRNAEADKQTQRAKPKADYPPDAHSPCLIAKFSFE